MSTVIILRGDFDSCYDSTRYGMLMVNHGNDNLAEIGYA